MSFHVVEYLDENGKPSGNYAKRFTELVDSEQEVDAKDEEGKPVKLKVPIKVEVYTDEPIPHKFFCVCDSNGNLKTVSEINFSHAIEVEGHEHCFQLGDGEECYPIEVLPKHPEGETDKLKWILDNHKMDLKKKRLVLK